MKPDDRGFIQKFEIGGAKFNVLFTKAGSLRAGDKHPVWQNDMVLSGSVVVETPEYKVEINSGGKISIRPDLPHLFRFLEDTVLIEWWEGEFEMEYYEPYRKQVEESLRGNNGS